MEFNIINENNEFKLGDIISIFKLPNDDREIALFSVSDFDGDSASLNVAYIKSMLVYEQEDAVLLLSIDGGEFVEEDSFVYSEGASIEVKIKESANYKESNSVTITVLISEV